MQQNKTNAITFNIGLISMYILYIMVNFFAIFFTTTSKKKQLKDKWKNILNCTEIQGELDHNSSAGMLLDSLATSDKLEKLKVLS